MWILQKWAGILKARSVFEGTGNLHKFLGLNIFFIENFTVIYYWDMLCLFINICVFITLFYREPA